MSKWEDDFIPDTPAVYEIDIVPAKDRFTLKIIRENIIELIKHTFDDNLREHLPTGYSFTHHFVPPCEENNFTEGYHAEICAPKPHKGENKKQLESAEIAFLSALSDAYAKSNPQSPRLDEMEGGDLHYFIHKELGISLDIAPRTITGRGAQR